MSFILLHKKKMSMQYNVSKLLIEYKNTTEYRQILRELFNMKDLDKQYNYEIDDETKDEENYDSDRIIKTLDELFELTKDNTLFQTLYDLAAAKMFSLERSIGQSILFSYDYLHLFHACLCVFIVSSDDFHADCEYYILLKKNLETR